MTGDVLHTSVSFMPGMGMPLAGLASVLSADLHASSDEQTVHVGPSQPSEHWPSGLGAKTSPPRAGWEQLDPVRPAGQKQDPSLDWPKLSHSWPRTREKRVAAAMSNRMVESRGVGRPCCQVGWGIVIICGE